MADAADATAQWAEYYKKLQEHQQQVQQYQQQQQQQQAEQVRLQAWQQYYAQSAQQQQQQQQYANAFAQQQYTQQQARQVACQQPTATAVTGAGDAGGASAASGSAYNSYSAYYGSSAQDTRWTQQQQGQVIGAGASPACTSTAGGCGSSGSLITSQSVTHAAVQAAARLRGSSGVSSSSNPGLACAAGGGATFQGFQLRQPSGCRPVAAATPAVAAPAPAPAANEGWPPALRAWVERAFAQCKSDAERACVEGYLRKRILRENTGGTMWATNWEREPLPPRSDKPAMYLPSPSSKSGNSRWGGRADDSDDSDDHGGRQKRAGAKRKAKRAAVNYFSHGGRGDDHSEYGGGRGDDENYVDAMEVAKRQKRAGRFEASGTSLAERAERWSKPEPTMSYDGETGDITLDYTVVGTSQTVEKKYLRLTAAPDPRSVRPEPVLRQAIELIRQKYDAFGEERGQTEYIYLWEQMMSVRQDLTVQRIRNAFTVEVYEMHARICLEFDDQTEFNQCLAQLMVLYEEGLGTKEAERELKSYDLLYNVGKGAHNNISNLMLKFDDDDRSDTFIRFALRVRAAAALSDYTQLFRLYTSAPGHAGHVMDTFVDARRLEAVKIVLKAYAPSVSLAYVSKNLGFDADDDCAYFLEDHGCVLNDARDSVDCKASRASLVEHSISQKLEEERKEAQRKAEIVPISFS